MTDSAEFVARRAGLQARHESGEVLPLADHNFWLGSDLLTLENLPSGDPVFRGVCAQCFVVCADLESMVIFACPSGNHLLCTVCYGAGLEVMITPHADGPDGDTAGLPIASGQMPQCGLASCGRPLTRWEGALHLKAATRPLYFEIFDRATHIAELQQPGAPWGLFFPSLIFPRLVLRSDVGHEPPPSPCRTRGRRSTRPRP